MSGHSKWNNIKRKKEKTDAAKAKIFTKIGRELAVIVKTGGANPNENSKLKDAIAKAKAPELDLDGELQADAALVPSVASKKCPDSKVAGQANVLVFPDLGAGNIGYKLVQRLGNAEAIGPVLQGIARPVNDLSRGCSIEDVYMMIAITANQAIAAKK